MAVPQKAEEKRTGLPTRSPTGAGAGGTGSARCYKGQTAGLKTGHYKDETAGRDASATRAEEKRTGLKTRHYISCFEAQQLRA
jgi:hypothetical protein